MIQYGELHRVCSVYVLSMVGLRSINTGLRRTGMGYYICTYTVRSSEFGVCRGVLVLLTVGYRFSITLLYLLSVDWIFQSPRYRYSSISKIQKKIEYTLYKYRTYRYRTVLPLPLPVDTTGTVS